MEQSSRKNFGEVFKIKKSRFENDPIGAFFIFLQNIITSNEDAATAYEYFQEILKKNGIDLNKDTKVLEIGSGNGVFLNYLKQQGVNAVGVDVRPEREGGVPQAIARIEELPFADDSFDVVFSISVFDSGIYNQDQKLMLKEISRVLKQGGVYVGKSESINVGSMSGLDEVTDSFGRCVGNVYKKP